MDDVVKEFLVESYENLDEMDRDLVALEKDPESSDVLARIFRTLHTIKGTCGFLGFSKLESVAHASENLLSKLRDVELLVNSDIASALLATVDAIREMMAHIEESGQEGDGEYSELVNWLEKLQKGESAPGPASITAAVEDAGEEPESTVDDGIIEVEPEVEPVVEPVAAAPEPPAPVEPPPPPPAPPVVEAAPPPEPEPIAVEQPSPEKVAVAEESEDEALAEASDEEDAAKPGGKRKKKSGASKKPKRAESSGGLTESSIRVDVAVLNTLMNLVGELVLARNQIVQFTALHEDIDTNLLAASQRLNLITTEMQEEVMKTRMQPIGNIWSKFPRVVRDLSHTCGKQVRIEMEGVETELDKTLLEAIKDPLTHLVRNSVDHGIEPPETRLENGKPAEGQLVLRAFHEGGMVNIEISDDGGGIDPQRIKAKALEKQLITNETSNKMSERELVNLIFQPGFSTAEKVTNVSGRGVGMDVVKTNMEKIGGTVDVSSQLGIGTTFKIKIPLTLAIIPALIVTCKHERYAIPQVSLLELVRLDSRQVADKIEMLHGAPVYRLRGNLLPLVYLSNELYPGSVDHSEVLEGNIENAFNIVVLQADDRQFGLVVDTITDSQEIVVKPLGKQLQGITVFAGATIMGDGHVALILDILGIAQQSNVVSEIHDTAAIESGSGAHERSSDAQTLLLCQSSSGGRLAIPLSIVARLEEFNLENVEAAGAQEVVQYRGEIMPLIRLSNMLPSSPSAGYMSESEDSDKLQVVVYSHHNRSVGLVVDRIIDIVEDSLEVQRESHHTGVLSSVVIQDRVTDMVDIEGVVRAFDPSFFDSDGDEDDDGTAHFDDSMTMW